MARWELLSDEQAQVTWDESLLRFADSSPFQTYEWAQYKRSLGWQPCYWAAFDDNGKIVAMMLGGLKRYLFGVGLVLCEGGPVGDLSTCNDSLHAAMRETTGLKRIYCRFRCDRQREVEDTLRLTSQGWSRSWFGLTSGYSMILPLDRSEEQVMAGCERNWRRNLKNSWERSLTVKRWENPNPAEVISVYLSMQKAKNLEQQHTLQEVEEIFNHLESLVLFRCEDEDGELLSLSGCLVIGNRAVLLLSACGERGRETLAAYAVLWGLIKHCLSLGIKELDLAGIDPVRNPGVHRFKRASGAKAVEYLGEWDWASSSWLQWFGNWAISRRQRLEKAVSTLETLKVSAPPRKSSGEIPVVKLRHPKAA